MSDLTQYTEAQLADWFVRNREWLEARKDEYETNIASVKEVQTNILTELQKRMNLNGVSSVRTDSGTIIKSVSTTYTAQDRNAFGQFIIESGMWEATSIRPTKEFVEEYAREHDGQLPPGVGVYSEQKVTIRKPSK